MKRARLFLPLLAVAAVAGALASCRVPNRDHCLHKAVDSNAWCASIDEERSFCSPCEAEHQGCVKDEPTAEECPAYSAAPADETGSSSGSESGTGTDGTGDSDSGESDSGESSTS